VRGAVDRNVRTKERSLPDRHQARVQDEKIEVQECPLSDLEIVTMVDRNGGVNEGVRISELIFIVFGIC
jgi:hypothetical protein